MKYLIAALLPLCASIAVRAESPRLLLQKPAMNESAIVFGYADDLWRVNRTGGEAVRLTAGIGVESDPVFSPDGALIAFRGEYEGNVDVFVVSAAGGVPKRLTWHPADDTPVAWTPDGRSVVFRSGRSYARLQQLFTISEDGGFETPIDLPMAVEASFSANGQRIAYVMLGLASTRTEA